MPSKSKTIAELIELDGDIVVSALDNVYDVQSTSTGGFSLPAGTTAQRPVSPQAGYQRFNTTINAIEVYDGTSWRTNASTGKSIAMTMVFG